MINTSLPTYDICFSKRELREKMDVQLLQYSKDIINIIYTACRTCYSKLTPIEIYQRALENKDTEKKLNLITKVMDSGHLSTAEHAYFTFSLCGVSRALMAQITRHRLTSFSIQSQRYVEIKEDLTMLYDIVGNTEKELEIASKYFVINGDTSLASFCIGALINYLEMIKDGAKAEDARMVLPNCTKTNIVMSCNLRELIWLCKMRLCKQAQAEIRQTMQKVRDCVIAEPECSWLRRYLIPNCKNCTDFRDCQGKG